MISDELEAKLEELKDEMKEPTTKEKKMEAQTETTTKRKVVVKKAAPAKKAAPVAKKKVATKKDDDNKVTLKDLAKEVKMEPRIARRILRKAGLETEGRWSWDEGSGALKKAREALTKAE